MRNPLARDLDHVLTQTQGLWDHLRHGRVFMTGGTGFFGCWLLETFLWANDSLKLDATIAVLTRRRNVFASNVPHLAAHRAVTLYEGDVRTVEVTDGAFSHVIHAATQSSTIDDDDNRVMFDTIVSGTRRMLEFSKRVGARRFLLTSSGAIYGRQPADLTRVPEEYLGGPNPADASMAYAEGKRCAEMLCAVYADSHLEPVIARCFAFVGPYLPLDGHFAAGNFVRDGLHGGPIRISGDGTPYRSYMYAADLAIWLWTILLHGQSMRPYNVGSETAITIKELAHHVAARFTPAPAVHVARTPPAGTNPERYVPSTARARGELSVTATIDLAEALARTVDWHRGRRTSPYVES